MVTSKIILLLRKLNKKEHSKFREFLCSPYFNNRSKLVQFYDKLMKHSPEFNEKKIDRTAIYRSLYPESTFNIQVYKNLSSELYSIAREFVSIHNFTENESEKELHMLKGLERMQADDLYKTEYKTIKKKLNSIKFGDYLYFYKFDLAILEKTFYFNRGNFKKGSDIGITDESDELLKFYLVHLFRQRFDLENSMLNLNIKYEINAGMYHMQGLMDKGVLDDTINFMIRNKTRDHGIIAMYYYLLKSSLNLQDDESFEKAKSFVFKNINKFDIPMRFVVSGSLFAVNTLKINNRALRKDYENAFEIIEFQLKRKIYKSYPESYITATEFRSNFMIGIYLKKFDWAKKYLKKYIDEVAPEQRTSLYNLLMAYIKFYENEPDNALDYLNNVKYDLFIYKLDVRKLQLLILYDQGHTESVISLMVAYKEFLNTNKNVSDRVKKSNMELIGFVTRIIRLNDKFNKFDLMKLENEIKENPYVLYRSWLIEKIDQLKK